MTQYRGARAVMLEYLFEFDAECDDNFIDGSRYTYVVLDDANHTYSLSNCVNMKVISQRFKHWAAGSTTTMPAAIKRYVDVKPELKLFYTRDESKQTLKNIQAAIARKHAWG